MAQNRRFLQPWSWDLKLPDTDTIVQKLKARPQPIQEGSSTVEIVPPEGIIFEQGYQILWHTTNVPCGPPLENGKCRRYMWAQYCNTCSRVRPMQTMRQYCDKYVQDLGKVKHDPFKSMTRLDEDDLICSKCRSNLEQGDPETIAWLLNPVQLLSFWILKCDKHAGGGQIEPSILKVTTPEEVEKEKQTKPLTPAQAWIADWLKSSKITDGEGIQLSPITSLGEEQPARVHIDVHPVQPLDKLASDILTQVKKKDDKKRPKQVIKPGPKPEPEPKPKDKGKRVAKGNQGSPAESEPTVEEEQAAGKSSVPPDETRATREVGSGPAGEGNSSLKIPKF